ncbi:MAG: hypothetical protein JWN26_540 [Candidatus Saccharibacteria bacterium]|nr:hypothetical protein [Candidatus Saccharibacteria bacterium]
MSAETAERENNTAKGDKWRKTLAVTSLALVGASLPVAAFEASSAVSADQQAHHDLTSIESVEATQGNSDAEGAAFTLSNKTLLDPSDIDILYKTSSIQVPVNAADINGPTVAQEIPPLARDLDSQALAFRAHGELEQRNIDAGLAGSLGLLTISGGIGAMSALSKKRKS